MFKLNVDDRLSSWARLRSQLETAEDPFQLVIEFWRAAPFVPYNKNIDPFNQPSWPSPWEIIVENKYDDFTKAIMMAYSLKFTQRFNNNVIQVCMLVDNAKNIHYNIIYVGDDWVINYNDNRVVSRKEIPDSFSMENIVEVKSSR